MITFQTAAKATRDALFLSTYDVTSLPAMVIAASFASLALAYTFSWLMALFGPLRVVPIALAGSAFMLLAEWTMLGPARQAVAVILYLHYAGLGALLISGFWSIVSERFDPRTAKQVVGRIAAGGTVGGLLGGLLAERVGALLSISAMLPILAGIHLLSAWLIFSTPLRHARPEREAHARSDAVSSADAVSGFRVLAETPYLRNLVLLVFLVTVSEMFIDYVFKARAFEVIGGGEQLLRFFALFYAGVALLTVLLQAVGARAAVQRLGLARTVGLMPGVSAIGSVAAIVVPGLPTAGLARGGEIVLRNSLYRAGYELLFTPISPRDKRATKTLVDVGVVRIGDIVGGALVQAVLVFAVVVALPMLLGLAVALSILAIYVATRLHRGYIRTLEQSLISQASQLEDLEDATTRTAILQTFGAIDLSEILGSTTLQKVVQQREETRESEARAPTAAVDLDPEIERILDLKSRDLERTRLALSRGGLTTALVPHVVPLLAWNDVATHAIRALRRVATQNVGQLVDQLLDPDQDFAVRRRLPLILAMCPSERSVDGLLRGLQDSRFEVRYRCGRALSHVMEANPDLTIAKERITAIVLREVDVDKGVWMSHRLLDQMDDESWSPVMDEVLTERANRSLEHVFTLLSLVLTRRPLKIAFRGLHTDDRMLRGTALEYLETALPPEVKIALWPFLEDDRGADRKRRSAKDIMAELLESHQSIVVNLEELRSQSGGVERPDAD